MNYIDSTDIFDRGALNGMHSSRHNYTDRSNHLIAAEQQLEQEHMWQVFEWFDDAVAALKRHQVDDIEETAWLLLKGMDEHHTEVTNGRDFYFNDWEIKQDKGLWRLANNFTHETRVRTWLLGAIDDCERLDNEPAALKAKFEADLTSLQVIRLQKVIRAETQQVWHNAQYIAERIDEERKRSVEVAAADSVPPFTGPRNEAFLLTSQALGEIE